MVYFKPSRAGALRHFAIPRIFVFSFHNQMLLRLQKEVSMPPVAGTTERSVYKMHAELQLKIALVENQITHT